MCFYSLQSPTLDNAGNIQVHNFEFRHAILLTDKNSGPEAQLHPIYLNRAVSMTWIFQIQPVRPPEQCSQGAYPGRTVVKQSQWRS